MKNDKALNVAIIGCGMISRVYLDTIINKFTILNVVACTDRDKERRDACASQYGLKALTYDQILQEPGIEMIINLTNPASHYEITKKALLHGKHVYSEKMLAITVQEGLELCTIADKKKLYLGSAPDTFLGSGIQTARYVVDMGLIGKPLSFIASVSRNYDILGNIIPHLWNKEGNILFDMGCYYLTALVNLFGSVDKVIAFSEEKNSLRRYKRITDKNFGEVCNTEAVNVISAALLFNNNINGIFHLNADTIPDETVRFEIYGTEGILYLSDPNMFGGMITIKRSLGKSFVFPATHGYSEESRGLGAAEMAWAIRQKRPHRASKELAYHILETTQAILTAAEEERQVSVESVCDRPTMLPKGFINTDSWGPTEESALALYE